ncbi:MAG: hypothetical protein K0R57_945 [Paenibacillaceae bacterium]|jgi:hypothetical protein|nr:hypothetical protein [Paenibacillaceae bacterium]
MTQYMQHQERLKGVLLNVSQAINELNQAREDAAKAQISANPVDRQHAWQKLEQAERSAEKARTALLVEANESQEQQIKQTLQELEDAMATARQF